MYWKIIMSGSVSNHYFCQKALGLQVFQAQTEKNSCLGLWNYLDLQSTLKKVQNERFSQTQNNDSSE